MARSVRIEFAGREIRTRTTVSQSWIAERLAMRNAAYVILSLHRKGDPRSEKIEEKSARICTLTPSFRANTPEGRKRSPIS